MKLIAILAIMLLFITACAQEKAPAAPDDGSAGTAAEPPAQVPSVDGTRDERLPQTAPAQGGIGQNTPGTDKTFGEVNRTSALDIDGFRCDLEERELTFRFRNNETSRSWQLNNKVPFPAPKDLVAIQVLVNSYQVNANTQPKNPDGELLFGPEWPFSENCGGVEVLGPGEDVTCTVRPVQLKSAGQLTTGHNEIFIKSPTSTNIIRFTCE